ncbi:MAG: hypothetical protein OEZ47_13235 [Gammaproteobacteria bacterium]|nr:hypothetical protein [Gammaproteobacteria bacterium]
MSTTALPKGLIDREIFDAICHMSDGQLRNIYTEFLDNTLIKIAWLKSAANDGQYKEIELWARNLTKQSENLGAEEFSKICHQLAEDAKRKDLHSKSFLIAEITKTFHLTKDELELLISSIESSWV